MCIAYNVNSTAAFTYLIFFHIQVFCKQENILGLYMWCVNFVADLCEIKTNFRYVEVGTSNRTKTNDMEYAKSKLNCRNVNVQVIIKFLIDLPLRAQGPNSQNILRQFYDRNLTITF